MVSIALYNLKGGVGKTAATINFAYLAAEDDYKTMVWDLDPQASASFYLHAMPTIKNESKKLLVNELELTDAVQNSSFKNLWVIPSDLSARNADVVLDEMKKSKKKLKNLISGAKEYDIVFIDCPPGISLLHENIFYAVDWILMPNIPTTLSIRSFDTVMKYFDENELNKNKIKCFFSMVDHRKNLHHEVIEQYYKDKIFLKSYIPYLSDVEKMGSHQQPIFEFAKSSYAAQCFRDLWNEVKKVCDL
jgi:chromosome partitioning protein